MKEPHRIAEISNRKRATYTENMIYPAVSDSDLRLDMLPKLRNQMLARDPNHPWSSLPYKELLVKAGLYRKEVETGKKGYTLAAVLLLGKDEVIHSAIPHYRIDALVRRVQVDRYDDRDRIECNLIESYGRLMAFVSKHLPDPFHLEGDVRVSLRDKIFREVVANLLVHREYMNAYPARLTIYNDRVETENASNYRTQGILDPNEMMPFSKNPTIAKFFAQLGWAEELGSGMVNIGKYLPTYSPGKRPEYRDGSVFRTVIPLPATSESVGKDFRVKFRENFRVKFGVTGKRLDRMTDMVVGLSTGEILVVERLSKEYGVSERTIHEDLGRLKQWDIVRFEGPPKTGTYVLTGKGKAMVEGAI